MTRKRDSLVLINQQSSQPTLISRRPPLRPPPGLRPPYRVLRRAEHCAPLTRHGLAFSQPSEDLATPP